MNRTQKLAVGVTLFLGSFAQACELGDSQPPANYQTDASSPTFVPGDRFEVRVFDEETLSGEYQVQDDGTVDFPLIGRIRVEGMSQNEASQALEARLADGYIRDPQVTVIVLTRENLEVSVLGQVGKPGTLPYVERLTLVQAISNAGGLTAMAAVRKVKLTRRTSNGPKTFEVSVKAITEGRAEDLLLQPGDIVFVPESAI